MQPELNTGDVRSEQRVRVDCGAGLSVSGASRSYKGRTLAEEEMHRQEDHVVHGAELRLAG